MLTLTLTFTLILALTLPLTYIYTNPYPLALTVFPVCVFLNFMSVSKHLSLKFRDKCLEFRV